ncbi:MAG: hypothetical protein M3Q65_15285 [Chloroflexota bacterium]|nr:hypothetical protein [Chloroflexota bacterium]
MDTAFVGTATPVIVAVATLRGHGLLPRLPTSGARFMATLPPRGRMAFDAWLCIGAALGLVLPAGALARWGRHASVRRALLPYALTLAAQVATEEVSRRVLAEDLALVTGTLYTGYRLHQLLRARRAFAAAPAPPEPGRRVVGGILAAGFAFWAGNLGFLTLVAAPRVARAGVAGWGKGRRLDDDQPGN